MADIPSRYNPRETEDQWYASWEKQNLFAATPDPRKQPYSIVIPPPNVTGILHMGHALNNTIQDILIRYHRMKGCCALWMPGTDHAGIATQNVVEKSLAKEGLKRQDLGREAFIERVWKWREEYGSTIIRQLKKLGSSCDWQRTRFTMDQEYSKAVVEVFVRLYEKGLIYRGNYIINWCPRCQTALSDEEAPHHPIEGHLYYLHYPLADNPQEFITVATTRPETMLGDTAVAVNPGDSRYAKYIGKTLMLPLMNRRIPVIADDLVDKEFGTGAVKVTPAHDPNDYAMGKKHGLEFINVMHPDGRMNENAGEYRDMDRYEARQVIVEDLQEQNLLEKIEPHELSAGHCYRCHTIIEPYLSPQWFVKMKPLSEPAIKAVADGRITFHPERWTKVYLNWMENIQDWCISRQIWWGHRIPVYYCNNCSGQPDEGRESQRGVIVSRTKPDNCPFCASADLRQDEDVLDTWFSSWLWPFATFGSEEDRKYFYPTSALVTAPEIIFFWVARMIMAGFEFMGDIPFKDVYIHGTVRDIEGKKMSKSLGNIIDPLEIIAEYGADALRFSIISITAQGQDVFLSKERFEQGRNFANKIWNAARLVLMNSGDKIPAADLDELLKKKDAGLFNRWIISRFYSMLHDLEEDIAQFKFNEASQLLYGFFWHEFCDWYLELVKNDFSNPVTQSVMHEVLCGFLRTLHPFMPFITEELWHRLSREGSVMAAQFPRRRAELVDQELEAQAAMLFSVVTAVRNLRATLAIKPDQKVNVSVYPHDGRMGELIEKQRGLLRSMANVEYVKFLSEPKRPEAALSALTVDADIYLHFGGLIDTQKEIRRIGGQIAQKKKWIASKESRLQDAKFLERAPEDVVAKEREGLAQARGELSRLEQMLKELS